MYIYENVLKNIIKYLNDETLEIFRQMNKKCLILCQDKYQKNVEIFNYYENIYKKSYNGYNKCDKYKHHVIEGMDYLDNLNYMRDIKKKYIKTESEYMNGLVICSFTINLFKSGYIIDNIRYKNLDIKNLVSIELEIGGMIFSKIHGFYFYYLQKLFNMNDDQLPIDLFKNGIPSLEYHHIKCYFRFTKHVDTFMIYYDIYEPLEKLNDKIIIPYLDISFYGEYNFYPPYNYKLYCSYLPCYYIIVDKDLEKIILTSEDNKDSFELLDRKKFGDLYIYSFTKSININDLKKYHISLGYYNKCQMYPNLDKYNGKNENKHEEKIKYFSIFLQIAIFQSGMAGIRYAF